MITSPLFMSQPSLTTVGPASGPASSMSTSLSIIPCPLSASVSPAWCRDHICLHCSPALCSRVLLLRADSTPCKVQSCHNSVDGGSAHGARTVPAEYCTVHCSRHPSTQGKGETSNKTNYHLLLHISNMIRVSSWTRCVFRSPCTAP